MSDTEATNPGADDTTLVDQSGVDEAEAHDDEDQADTEDNSDQEPEDDSEEVEYEGAKYRIPKALKGAVMMHADYTRKTQEVADQRRTWEQERAQQAESFEALKVEHATVTALEAQVANYATIDWNAEFAADPDNARLHYDRYRLIQDQLGKAKSDLSEKETQRLNGQREARAKALEETGKVLARDIQGWSPQLATDIAKTAAEFGVTEEEMGGLADPRLWKVFHALHQAKATQKTQATVQRHEKAGAVQPAKTVAGKSGGFKPGLDDSLPMDVWMQRRRAQLAKG